MIDRIRALRYKRPALASMGAYNIMAELDDIVEACNGVRYYIEQADNDETLLNALDGDEDVEWEFRMAFADLSAKADELQMRLYEQDFEDFYRDFDDATVALIGNRYELVGYDSEEEDYFSLTSYEEGLAQTEAGKRLCRLTKSEMIERIGWAFGILLAFLICANNTITSRQRLISCEMKTHRFWIPSKRLKRLTMTWMQTDFTNGQQARSVLTGYLRRSQTVRG